MSNNTPPVLVGVIGSLTDSFDEGRLFNEFNALMSSLDVPDSAVLLHGGRESGTVASILGSTGARTIAFPPVSMIDDSIPFNSYLFFVRNKQIINSSDVVVFITDPQRAREAEVNPAMEYANDIKKEHYILSI